MKRVDAPRDLGWEAMKQGDYEKAIVLYEIQAAERAKLGQVSDAILNNKATALTCLEKYEDARRVYADQQADYEKRKAPFSARLRLSVATWLCGARADAIELATAEIDAIHLGKTGYLSSEFGVEEGRILLYFAAVSKDQDAIEHAMAHLKQLRAKPLGQSSPPGILDFLLNDIAEDEARALVRARATSVVLSRDEMVLDFCVAIKAVLKHGTSAAAPSFRAIAEKPNPLLLHEWYLARAESRHA
jgi:tetratricopeptide (TPR) repeat protein